MGNSGSLDDLPDHVIARISRRRRLKANFDKGVKFARKILSRRDVFYGALLSGLILSYSAGYFL